MISSRVIGNELDRCINCPEVSVCALLTIQGTVYESRETSGSFLNRTERLNNGSPKLRARVLGLFAASAWQELAVQTASASEGSELPKWVGSELENFRIVVVPAGKLLIFVASSTSTPWGTIQGNALTLADEMTAIVGDFDARE